MENDEKQCPRCAETVKSAAVVCKHCGYEFGAPIISTSQSVKAESKKKKSGCIWAVAIVGGLILIGTIANQKNTETSTNTSAPTEPEPQGLQVTALELAQAYSANEVAAQKSYGNQTLDVTGIVSGITLDFKSDPVIQLAGTNQFLPVQASFDKSFSDRLSTISKGQQVTVRCKSITEVISAPMLSDCTLP